MVQLFIHVKRLLHGTCQSDPSPCPWFHKLKVVGLPSANKCRRCYGKPLPAGALARYWTWSRTAWSQVNSM